MFLHVLCGNNRDLSAKVIPSKHKTFVLSQNEVFITLKYTLMKPLKLYFYIHICTGNGCICVRTPCDSISVDNITVDIDDYWNTCVWNFSCKTFEWSFKWPNHSFARIMWGKLFSQFLSSGHHQKVFNLNLYGFNSKHFGCIFLIHG